MSAPTWLRAAHEDAARAVPDQALRVFADRLLSAALAVPEPSRFGPDKVFLGPLRPAFDFTIPEFDAWAGESNRRGLLRLSRADLVALMDPALVRVSEVHYLNATFHFVRLDSPHRGRGP